MALCWTTDMLSIGKLPSLANTGAENIYSDEMMGLALVSVF